MNVREFDEKYKKFGGIKTLTKMRGTLATQEAIAIAYRVSKERVRQWMLEFFGDVYDPRPERKESIIQSMIDFAKMNPYEDFKYAYLPKDSSDKELLHYYEETLKRCKEEKIYDIK